MSGESNRTPHSPLSPKRSQASGRLLYQKISKAIKPVGYLEATGQAFLRVENDANSLLVTWWTHGEGNPPAPILLYPHRGVVKAQVLDATGRGWLANCFRRFGSLLVGGGSAYEGNWVSPLAVAYRWTESGWKQQSIMESGDRLREMRFASRSGNGILVTTREYEKSYFVSPLAGPALNFDSTWSYQQGKFRKEQKQLKKNALAAFDSLIGALETKSANLIRKLVPNQQQRNFLIRETKGLVFPYHAICVDGGIRDEDSTFGIENPSNRSKSVFVKFARSGESWVAVKVGYESDFQ